MGAQSPNTRPQPPPSALHTHLLSKTDPTSPHDTPYQHLALQVQHNLQHQHRWTDLRIHNFCATTSPTASSSSSESTTRSRQRIPLPRPMISGRPPQRLYIHPDEQIALLKAQKEAGKGPGLGDVRPVREWVLPSQLREKWSLRRFGEVFDGIDLDADEEREDGGGDAEGEVRRRGQGMEDKEPWRNTKRVLLATVDDDGTIVYYVVHDGLVKPRQN